MFPFWNNDGKSSKTQHLLGIDGIMMMFFACEEKEALSKKEIK